MRDELLDEVTREAPTRLFGHPRGPCPAPMLRYVIALSAMVVGLSTAQAAEPTTLTLTCQGTMTFETPAMPPPAPRKMESEKPEAVSMGIIVDFTKNAVYGFGFPGYLDDPPVNITYVDEVLINFHGSKSSEGMNTSIGGTVDRVTGRAQALHVRTDEKDGEVLYRRKYELQCRPVKRMF
jgi:hypothetical protein